MAISRTGPLTRFPHTVALGLAKILVGVSAANITTATTALDATEDSLGALNSSGFTSNIEYWKLESGFPMLEDLTIPLRESCAIECEFKEIHARNLAIARGIDVEASSGEYEPHSLEGWDNTDDIPLGTISAPDYVRAEAVYTYPNGEQAMYIIFPRANVTSSVEISMAAEDNANVPITIEAKRADSGVSGGDSTWDSMPLGRIYWDNV